MKRALLLLLALAACQAGEPVQAQAIGPNGLPYVHSVDGGIVSGLGTRGTPFNATLSHDTTLSGDGAAGTPLGLAGSVGSEWFGSGIEGACSFDGTSVVKGITPSGGVYQLTRDLYCDTVTLTGNAVVSLQNAGTSAKYLYAKTSITSTSSVTSCNIRANGANGVGQTGGTTTVNGGGVGGLAGGNGGTTAAGVSTSAGSGCVPSITGLTSSDKGGVGGAGVTAAGTVTVSSAACIEGTNGAWGHLPIEYVDWTTLSRTNGTIFVSRWSGGSGGGGGGVTGQFGGGGGSGGGAAEVWSPSFSGIDICANGGNGGDSANVANATGGGGGGQGGFVFAAYSSGSPPTVHVDGGIGGAGHGGGANGNNGSAGWSKVMYLGETR